MNLEIIKTTTKMVVNKGLLKVRKNSPEILLCCGLAGMAGTIFLACKATLKADELLAEHQDKISSINDAREDCDLEKYTEQDYKKDLLVAKTQTVANFVKLYGPAASLFITSTGCILGAHHIMAKRNVALMAAYKLIEQSFGEYRKRVVDELGEEKDFHFANGTEYEQTTEETTDPETGKKKKVKKNQQVLKGQICSPYARLFDRQVYDADGIGWTGSSQWSKNADYNAATLVLKNNWCNEHLKAQGYLFLNDVYDELGFPRTKAGQAVGWVWQGDGDNYISFGSEVDAIMNKTEGHLDYSDGTPILVDFNVDGVIWDLIDEK